LAALFKASDTSGKGWALTAAKVLLILCAEATVAFCTRAVRFCDITFQHNKLKVVGGMTVLRKALEAKPWV
jgi:uncharacterized cupredoxin-like copper-binding protein